MQKCLVLAAAMLCASCSSVTPTKETISSYSIYDVKGPATISPAAVGEAITNGLKEGSSGIQVSRNIPPNPIPDNPGRFTLVNPLGKSGLGALAAAQGASLTVPDCSGALVVGNAQNSSMKEYGENTVFYVCAWQYKDGYHIDFYTRFDRKSGGFSVKTLTATAMRPLVGDSSQFIPRTINNVVAAVQNLGMTATAVESYP